MQFRLMAHALSGNETIVSSFSAAADAAGLTETGRLALEKRREQFAALMRTTMASQERLAALQQRMDGVEAASYEALLEADDNRRSARRELEQLRERAYQITKPDGRTVRVYRDGDVVRDESGAVISRDIIRAEDIPDSVPTWQRMQATQEADRDAERRYREIVEYRERLARHREETADGGVTTRRADEIEADIEAMPDSVRGRLGETPRPERRAEITPPGQAVLTPGPM